MAWQGDGTFIRSNGTNSGTETWQDDLAAGTDILADRHDTHDQDLADGIAATLAKNNESKPTADFRPNATATYDLGSKALKWTNLYASGGVVQLERADHAETPAATYGETWVKNEVPNALYFTNDAGTDFPLTGRFSVPVGMQVYGLETAHDTDTDHDIQIAVGSAPDSTRAAVLTLTSVLTKRIDLDWTVGDDGGGLAPSARSVADTPNASTTYHFFLIMNSAGLVDAGWDTSVTATNLLSDTSYTYYFHLASHIIDGSNNITAYQQDGDNFTLDVPVQSVNDTSPGTSANTYDLDVPLGKVFRARIGVAQFHNSTGTQGLITALDQTDTAPSASIFTLRTNGSSVWANVVMDVKTNTSGQIRYRQSDTSADIQIVTLGWIHAR